MQFVIINSDLTYSVLKPDEKDKHSGYEMGMLKIKPNRIHIIMSPERGFAEIERYGRKKFRVIDIFDGRYVLLAEDSHLKQDGDFAVLLGSAYVMRKQGDEMLRLDFDDIDALSEFLSKVEHRSDRMPFGKETYGAILLFKVEDDAPYYN